VTVLDGSKADGAEADEVAAAAPGVTENEEAPAPEGEAASEAEGEEA
jgi:hypothetical protein